MSVLLIYFLVINLLGFFLIWLDKKRAIANQFRISEKTLLAIVAFGGCIGSGLAMFLFRHKTSKSPYLFKFFGIVVVQVLVLIYYLS